jgi:transposase-like protein
MGKQQEDAGWLDTRRELVEAVQRGLVTSAEVAAQLGVSGSVLGGWVRAEQMRRAKAGTGVPAGRGTFRRVSLVGPRARRSGVADVVLRGGRRVRVAAGFDAAEVRRLVEALESC